VAPALALAVVLVLAAAATAQTVTRSSGAVSATFTFDYHQSSVGTPYSHLRLTISRSGRALYSAPVNDRWCGTMCWPNQPGTLAVADVEGNGQPDVLLNLYTGGAHCCSVTEVYRPTAAHGYTRLTHIWGDPDYRLERLTPGGPYRFVTGDDRYAYEFAAYAFTGLPLEILKLSGARFVNVTRSYPKLVERDASGDWKYYRENRRSGTGLGFLGAWAADEYTLGRGAAATHTIAALERAGQLRSSTPGYWSGGAKFIARLDAFLRKTGYSR